MKRTISVEYFLGWSIGCVIWLLGNIFLKVGGDKGIPVAIACLFTGIVFFFIFGEKNE